MTTRIKTIRASSQKCSVTVHCTNFMLNITELATPSKFKPAGKFIKKEIICPCCVYYSFLLASSGQFAGLRFLYSPASGESGILQCCLKLLITNSAIGTLKSTTRLLHRSFTLHGLKQILMQCNLESAAIKTLRRSLHLHHGHTGHGNFSDLSGGLKGERCLEAAQSTLVFGGNPHTIQMFKLV